MSETTNQRLLLTWALCATLVAVGALGYIAGKQAGRSEPAAMTADARTSTSPDGTPAPERPQYVIPEAFADVPTQWRSAVRSDTQGYAALFDPQRQRLILERCQHHSYASAEAVDSMGDFCSPLASGRLATLETQEATMIDRSGNTVTVGLTLGRAADEPTLRMTLDGLKVELIPGSRNDLMQAIEALPNVQDNKKAYLVAMMAPTPGDERQTTDGEDR